MRKLSYTITTPNKVFTTVSYEEAVKLSKIHKKPFVEVFTREKDDLYVAPRQKNIVKEFGSLSSENVEKYILSHTNEDGEIIE